MEHNRDAPRSQSAGDVMSSDDQKNWQKKQAFQIVSQLPDSTEEAWAVLAYVEQMVTIFFGPRPSEPSPAPSGPGGSQVVHFPGGSSTPSRRASSTDKPSGLP